MFKLGLVLSLENLCRPNFTWLVLVIWLVWTENTWTYFQMNMDLSYETETQKAFFRRLAAPLWIGIEIGRWKCEAQDARWFKEEWLGCGAT